MPSPFPGMNPYFEREGIWEGFHSRLINRLGEVLVQAVRPHFIVQVEEQLYLVERSADQRSFLGRADVAAALGYRPAPASWKGTATLTAPARGRIPEVAVDEVRLPHLIICNREDQEVVTAVELLSPYNKLAGPDREQYLAKRRRLLRLPIHFVELDLLRGKGERMPMEGLPPCDYCVMVSRAEERPDVGLWPLRLADPLPTIPVPLRGPLAEARLDLQAVLHHVYDVNGYEDYLYRGTPQPRLTAEQDAWARAFLPAAPG
jgi:hypothetical protein